MHLDRDCQSVIDFLKSWDAAVALPELPPLVAEAVTLYQQLGVSTYDWETAPKKLVVALLEEVWWSELEPGLRRQVAAAREWTQAVAFLAMYLDPVSMDYVTRQTVEHVCRQLADPDWLERWLRDCESREKVTDAITGAGDKTPPTTKTIGRWIEQGGLWWCRGLQRWLWRMRLPVQGRDVFPRPGMWIERRGLQLALEQRFEAARQARAWVAIVGLPGSGKTVVMGDLVRSLTATASYTQRHFPGGVAQLSPAREYEGAVPYLAALVAQLTHSPVALNLCPADGLDLLRSHLQGQAALLVVDNVERPLELAVLRQVPEVMVVVALRSIEVAEELGITAPFQIEVGALGPQESRELLLGLSGREAKSEDEARALEEIVALLEGHPLALRLVASQALRVTWAERLAWLQDLEARHKLLGHGAGELNLRGLFTAFWTELPEELRVALGQLRDVPLFSSYDLEVGQAVWQCSREAAQVMWERLAGWQVVEPIAANRYRMHALCYDVLQEQGEGASERRAGAWIRRYPVQAAWPGWRGYWTCVPPLPPELSWPLWKPTTPGRERHAENKLWMSAAEHATALFWQTQLLGWETTALEYVVLHRKSALVRRWALAALLVALLGGGVTVGLAYMGAAAPVIWALLAVGVVGAGVLLGMAIMQWRDIQRLLGWRLLERPLERVLEGTGR